jgi:hypothetical protein
MADFGSAEAQHADGSRTDGLPPASDSEGSRPRGFPPATPGSGFALLRAAETRGGPGVTPRPFEMLAFAFCGAVLDAGVAKAGPPSGTAQPGTRGAASWRTGVGQTPIAVARIDGRTPSAAGVRGAVRTGSQPQASAAGPGCRRTEPPAVSHRVMEVGAVVAVSSSREQAAPGGAAGRDGGDGGRVRQWEAGPGGAERAQRRGNGEAGSPAAFAAGLLDEDHENKASNAPES